MSRDTSLRLFKLITLITRITNQDINNKGKAKIIVISAQARKSYQKQNPRSETAHNELNRFGGPPLLAGVVERTR